MSRGSFRKPNGRRTACIPPGQLTILTNVHRDHRLRHGQPPLGAERHSSRSAAARRSSPEPEQIERADKIVLPGVGAFQDAVATLRDRRAGRADPSPHRKGQAVPGHLPGPADALRRRLRRRRAPRPGRAPRQVRPLRRRRDARPESPAHGLEPARRPPPLADPARPARAAAASISSTATTSSPPTNRVIATTTDYGGPFVSSIWRDNVFATQFHPEKSQKVGLQILANFAAI